MAFDYGKKRTGIAVTDPLKIIANALNAVETAQLFDFLKTYLQSETIEAFIVGYPLDLKGKETDATLPVKKFTEALSRMYPHIPIHFIDERFSSKMAMQTLVSAGTTKKYRKEKGNIDKISAVILLQEWLNKHS